MELIKKFGEYQLWEHKGGEVFSLYHEERGPVAVLGRTGIIYTIDTTEFSKKFGVALDFFILWLWDR